MNNKQKALDIVKQAIKLSTNVVSNGTYLSNSPEDVSKHVIHRLQQAGLLATELETEMEQSNEK